MVANANSLFSSSTRICILLGSMFLLSCAVASDNTRPNIVLIVADYMGYSDTGPYGATDIRTPSLDALAAKGVLFSDFYAASPVCGPSRAALLSGRYPALVGMESNIGARNRGLLADNNSLLRELKAADYRTAMVGKWHLGNGPEYSPLAHGFDRFLGFHSWTLGYHDHLTSSGKAGLYRGNELVSEEGYLTDLFSDEATKFIEESAAEPFFLYLAYNVALPPYQRHDLPRARWSEGWDENEASRTDYVAMVESMDAGIGRVLQKLKALNLDENTVIVFTVDHGGRHLARSDPLFHGFATLWEGGIRVPLLMAWPEKFSEGVMIERPTISMDVTSTLLSAVGRSSNSLNLDGRSLLPLLLDGEDVPAASLFWRFYAKGDPMRAVRRGKWKYMVDRGSQLLFDLEADPGERRNQFSSRPDVVDELRNELTDWELSLEVDR
ncbi:MAG: sulfatase-like hydrolase/transferase [Pseudomonadota bacterium]